MATALVSDEEFISIWQRCGSIGRAAKLIGTNERAVAKRRRSIESRHGITLETADVLNRPKYQHAPSCPQRISLDIRDGAVMIGSDAHVWPGELTPAMQAFIRLAKKLKPAAVVLNGDVFDGARISRHDRFGWENLPSVIDELTAVKDALGKIQKAAPDAKLIRTRGNHDLRFEKYLSMHVPEFAHVRGFRLTDHIPQWDEAWSVWVNGHTVIKHRQANGIHAVYNNTVKAGTNIVTGHLHSLKVTPWTDYNGTRYGIDCGTLSDPWGPQYEYMEDGPRNWVAGFAVLTFRDGALLPPELCTVTPQGPIFRGNVA